MAGMSLDILILIGVAFCQAATGYWAFHMSVESGLARWGFAAVTVIGVGLIVWSGFRGEQASNSIATGISIMQRQLTRIASAANVNPNQSVNALADTIIAKFNNLQTEIDQTKTNVQALQNPPPNPNTLYQNGKPVADVITASPSSDGSSVIFGELDNVSIDFSQHVFFRGYELQCDAKPGDFVFGTSPTTGRAAQDVYTDVSCSVVSDPK